MADSSREPSDAPAVPNARRDVLLRARQLLASHAHFCAHSGAIRIEGDEENLLLLGQVPTFHLKQLAEEALSSLDVRIDNQIDVVCVEGLSSTPHSGVSDQSPRPKPR